MIRVGFTGARKGMTVEQERTVSALLLELQPIAAHHGDCVGADAQFHQLVRDLSPITHIVIHPPTDPKVQAFCQGDTVKEIAPYLVRNHNIVDECTILIGTPDGEERLRSGTWATIRYARKTGRDLRIVMPDGTTTS